jgi:hypothetical protein
MTRIGTYLALMAIFGLLLAPAAFAAQRGMQWHGSGGWGPGSQYHRLYDTSTVQTMSGEVVSVDHVTPMQGMSSGIHMTVKTATETVSVHLAPSWYLENQDVKLEPKDTVEVTGSRITFQGKPAVIAAEVRKGEEVLKLRDDNGFPVWAGWRRR